VAASSTGLLQLAAVCLVTSRKLAMMLDIVFETGTASLSLASFIASGPAAAGRQAGCEASGEIRDKSPGGCLHPQRIFPDFMGPEGHYISYPP